MDLKTQFNENLQKCPILAILRGIGVDEVKAVCDVLYDNGITLLEVPMNTPNALGCIRIAAEHCNGRQLVGAGTVLEPQQVTAVKEAGGEFIGRIAPRLVPEQGIFPVKNRSRRIKEFIDPVGDLLDDLFAGFYIEREIRLIGFLRILPELPA